MKLKKKYFLDEEFEETISSSRFFENKKPLVKKEYTYKFSGSRYIGEWKGGFRHGKGLMLWQDGAKYEGDWNLGKATG